MDDLIKRACLFLDVKPEQVINPRVEGDEFVLIVDKGRAGCPKYRLLLASLPELPKPKAKPKQPPKPKAKPAASRPRKKSSGKAP